MEQKTKVIFRKWKEHTGSAVWDGSIIALFPEIPGDFQGQYCGSFEHIGQHGNADYNRILEETVPAAPTEFASLKEELEKEHGYNLEVVNRVSWRMHENRRKDCRNL